MVAKWVANRPIFEVCAQEDMEYAIGGRRQAPWWRQLAADAELTDMFKAILEAEKERQRQEPGRLGENEEQKDLGSYG